MKANKRRKDEDGMTNIQKIARMLEAIKNGEKRWRPDKEGEVENDSEGKEERQAEAVRANASSDRVGCKTSTLRRGPECPQALNTTVTDVTTTNTTTNTTVSMTGNIYRKGDREYSQRSMGRGLPEIESNLIHLS